ncbi:hypothetical protein Tco_1493073 [Tanacetum coccineum]
MKRGFLSQKGSGRERGVKEKDLNENKKNTTSGIGLSTESDDTMNEDTPVGVASAVKEGVTQSVVDKTAEKEKLSSLEDTTVLGSFPPLSTPGTTTSGNAPSKSLYANSIRAINERFTNTTYGFFLGKKVAYLVVANYVRNTCGKYGLVHSMFSSSTALFSFQFSSMDGLDAMLENGLWFIRNNSLIVKKRHPNENLMKEDISTDRSSYARAMIELRADVELKDNIIVAMPKLTREGHYICNVRVEYEWKPPRCASCKVFGHIHEECPKNTGVGEKKTLKKPSQTSRGVLVGPKIGLKSQKEYRRVPKKPTASSSGNKKKGVVPTIKVPIRGTTNLVNNDATSSGSSFMNVDNSSTRTTPIIDKIGKFKESLTSGKATLVYQKAIINAGQLEKRQEPCQILHLLPLGTVETTIFPKVPKSSHDDGSKPSSDDGKKFDEDPRKKIVLESIDQDKKNNVKYYVNNVKTASTNEV